MFGKELFLWYLYYLYCIIDSRISSFIYHLQKEKCCGAIGSIFWSTLWDIKNIRTKMRIAMQINR